MRTIFQLLIMALLMGSPAFAYPMPHADLVCAPEKNLAVARFVEADDEKPPAYIRLPTRLDGGLSAQPGTGRRDCTLANGWRIRLRNGQNEAFAYGAGGAAPGSFFSLWIEGRKVLSRRMWTNYDYATDLIPVAGIAVSPAGLALCEGDKKLACKTTKLDLGKEPVDEIEYPRKVITHAADGNQFKLNGLDIGVCAYLIQTGADEIEKLDYVQTAQSDPDVPVDVKHLQWIDRKKLEEAPDQQWMYASAKNWFGFEFNNEVNFSVRRRLDFNGEIRDVTVVRRESLTHYFDGSYIVVAPDAVPVIDIIRGLYAGEGPDDDEEKAIERARAKGWLVYAGGAPDIYPDHSFRYVSVEYFSISGSGYMYFQPRNRDVNPLAQVMKIERDGKLTPACSISRPLQNY